MATIQYDYKYQSDGTTLGAEGPNIKVGFEYKPIVLDDSNSEDSVYVSETGVISFANYANPYYTANYQSYQRDEVYRFAIKFYDDFGGETSPLWICDLRIPHILDPEAANSLFDSLTSKVVGYSISPVFTVKSFPSGVTSYQILRVERTSSDKSIIAQGTVRPTMPNNYTGSNDNRDDTGYQTSVHRRMIDNFNGGSNAIFNKLLEFYSPEISFYPNSFPVTSGEYIEIMGYYGSIFGTDLPTILNIDQADGGGNLISLIDFYYNPVTESESVLNPVGSKILRSTESILEGDFPETTTFKNYSIGDHKFWTYLLKDEADDRMARKNSSMVFAVNYDSADYVATDKPFNYGGVSGFKAPMLANYKRNNYSTMYGGNTYSARQNNRYLSITDIINKDTNPSIAPYRGDVFISAFDLQPISYEYALAEDETISGASLMESNIVPIESSINTELRSGNYITSSTNTEANLKYLNEDGYDSRDIEPLYIYNTAYSSSNDTKKVAVITSDQEARTTNVFNNRIVASNRKINGEKMDSWLRYPANNYLDVDSAYGDIIALLNYEDKLYFFQERAVGVASVNERSLIQDTQGQQLALGTGTLLSRFDYITTDYGCVDKRSIVDTQRGLYWYDSYNNTIVRMQRDQYNNMQIASLSKQKSMQPFLNYYDFCSCVAGKDPKHDEVLFTLSTCGGDIKKTIVFNERVDVFQSEYTFSAKDFINVNRNLLSANRLSDIYIHSRDDCYYGKFYGETNDSYIKLLVNSNIGFTKVFDVMNYINQSNNSSGHFIFYDTFDKIRVYNTYQNSDWVDLVRDDTVTKRGKDWSLQVPRNAISEDLDSNPDIFKDSNLNQQKDYQERMRDKYLYVELEYSNSNNYRFNVPLFVTKYRLSYR